MFAKGNRKFVQMWGLGFTPSSGLGGGGGYTFCNTWRRATLGAQMKRQVVWGTCGASMWTDQGIASAQFSGVLRSSSATLAIADFAAFLAEANAAASLIDYSSAEHDFKSSALSRTVRQQATLSGVLVRPSAYIVRHDELPFWQAYARQMCGSGLLRAAFADAGQARAWVAEMAALVDAQATHHALWR